MITSGSDLCNHLYVLAKKNNGQNTWLSLNGIPAYIIQNLENASHVLLFNEKNYLKNTAWLKQILGHSRFTEDKQAWKTRANLTQPFFNKFDKQNTCQQACHYAQKALYALSQNSNAGQTTIDDNIFRHLAMSVLMETFFGISFNQAQINISNLVQLMTLASEYAFVPPGQTRKHITKDALHHLFKLRRQTRADMAPFKQGAIPPSPLLNTLIAADQRGDTVFEHELISLFAAGSETTAATLGWLCYLLARHPQQQEELYQACKPYQNKNTASWTTLSQLPIINAWLSETIRLYPASPLLDRIAIQDDRIGNEPIAAGSNVMISLIGIHHDQKLHPNPWELDLKTAISPTQNTKNNGIRTGFSFGPRICGGKNFALTELTAFLYTFVTHARFELTSHEPPQFSWKSLLLREGGHPVRTILR